MNFKLKQQPVFIITLLGLTLAAGLGIWLPAPFGARFMAAGLLALLLPGWALLRAARLTAPNWPTQGVLTVGVSYALTLVMALGLLYAFGHLSTTLISVALIVLILGLGGVDVWRGVGDTADTEPVSGRTLLFFGLPLLVAAFLSFTNLGYSDYWGDEMNGLLRAVAIISGQPEIIFEHTKGPVEVLLPAVFGLLAGRFEPFTLRFPFALAHVVGIGGFFWLGQRMFGRQVGLIAALLLVINGLYVAFGRIIQYQAVVFMMTSLALLLAHQFYREGRVKNLIVGLFLAAVGLLAHYDLLLALPVVGYLGWQYYIHKKGSLKKDGLRLAAALALFGLVAAAFYVPFLLHPNITKTGSYLNRIIGVANWPANSFDELYIFGVLYNSRYYMGLIALLGGGVLVVDLLHLWQSKPQRRFWWLTGSVLLLSLLAVVSNWIAVVPLLLFSLLFAWLVFFAPLSVESKAIYVWIGVSFVGYVFFVDHPRTHLQIIYPGWSLLAGQGLVRLGQAVGRFAAAPALRRRVLWGGGAAFAALLSFFVYYEYLLFADANSEYIFTYPTHKNSLYWEDENFPFGSRRLYGAPHRLGWQMVNALYTQGNFSADWDSNDDGSNLFWYTLGAPRNACYPRYYFLTQFDQKGDDSEQSPPDLGQLGYIRLGEVWQGERLQLEIFEFAPLRQDEVTIWPEPATYASFVTPDDFRIAPYQAVEPEIATVLPTAISFRPAPSALQQIAAHYNDPRIVQVRDAVNLVGYNLDTTWAEPGGAVVLTLYWQAAQPINLPYKVFVHLESGDGAVQAQSDDSPACNTRPTPQWQVGETVADRHVIWLPPEMKPGEYTLRIGLYEPKTGLRMDLLDALGNPQGNSFELTQTLIRLPS